MSNYGISYGIVIVDKVRWMRFLVIQGTLKVGDIVYTNSFSITVLEINKANRNYTSIQQGFSAGVRYEVNSGVESRLNEGESMQIKRG